MRQVLVGEPQRVRFSCLVARETAPGMILEFGHGRWIVDCFGSQMREARFDTGRSRLRGCGWSEGRGSPCRPRRASRALRRWRAARWPAWRAGWAASCSASVAGAGTCSWGAQSYGWPGAAPLPPRTAACLAVWASATFYLENKKWKWADCVCQRTMLLHVFTERRKLTWHDLSWWYYDIIYETFYPPCNREVYAFSVKSYHCFSAKVRIEECCHVFHVLRHVWDLL